MKIIFNFKLILGLLLTLNLQSAIINHQSFNIYGQDPQLFEHTWYFQQGILDGEEFFPLVILNGELNISNDFFSLIHSYCEEGFTSSIININNETFFLDEVDVVLVGSCGDPEELDFMFKHYLIYGIMDGSGIANNPFNYLIEPIDNYFQLTIENGEGDWAVYNSVLLSMSSFNESSFYIYPIPVKEMLYINSDSKQQVTATIYDISGKELQKHHSFEDSNKSIDIKALNPGLYFVVFENETGERVSKKFVKK